MLNEIIIFSFSACYKAYKAELISSIELAILVAAIVAYQVQNMFAEAIKTFGTIDILINNAGLQRDAKFVDMTLEQWNFVIGVNLTGQFLCARGRP